MTGLNCGSGSGRNQTRGTSEKDMMEWYQGGCEKDYFEDYYYY